jgi:hypothetical protein
VKIELPYAVPTGLAFPVSNNQPQAQTGQSTIFLQKYQNTIEKHLLFGNGFTSLTRH